MNEDEPVNQPHHTTLLSNTVTQAQEEVQGDSKVQEEEAHAEADAEEADELAISRKKSIRETNITSPQGETQYSKY